MKPLQDLIAARVHHLAQQRRPQEQEADEDQARALYSRGIEVATERGDSHARGELQSALAEAA